MMKKNEIGIRDPFVLVDEGKYYLYGTRNTTAWGKADGFDVYVSDDMENWSEKKEIFHNDGTFWATQNYWAPECVKYHGKYYLIATFGSETRKKGIQILESDRPDGIFVPKTKYPITPDEWECLDGTLYWEDQTPWLIFSHSVPEECRGAMCAAQLSDDLADMKTKPQVLFYASEAAWSRPIPFAKEAFGVDGDAYFSDGPYLFKNETGDLCMLWSSWGEKGYEMGISKSANGKITGIWKHQPKSFFQDGGHGMIFTSKEGERLLTFHAPNDSMKERPIFEKMKKYYYD